MRRQNKGFSLVELVAAVAILAIVGSMVLVFLNSGLKSYTQTDNTVNLQNEAQRALDQIQEMLIDAGNGVTYSADQTRYRSNGQFVLKSEEPDNYNQLSIFNQTAQKGVDGATVDVYTCGYIFYDAANRQLLYTEYEYPTDSSGNLQPGTAVESTKNSVLAKNVEKFRVDLSELEKSRKVKIEIGFKVKDQEFKTEKTIVVRNKIWTADE